MIYLLNFAFIWYFVTLVNNTFELLCINLKLEHKGNKNMQVVLNICFKNIKLIYKSIKILDCISLFKGNLTYESKLQVICKLSKIN